jgi:sigma-B regulation protein RsbU (phosphoserine phosphatase)
MALQTTAAHDWIHDTCRRFSDATGWPIRYVVPSESTAVGKSAGQQPDMAEHCWSRELHDGDEPAGWLQIDLPAEVERDRSFLAVCDLATLLAELMSELITVRRSLDRRTNDVSTLVDLGMSLGNDDEPLGTLNRLLKASVELTGFRSAAFFLLTPSVNRLNLRDTSCINPDSIPFPQRELQDVVPDLTALAHGRTLIRRQAPQGDDTRWLPDDCSTALCVAVESDAGPLGTLWVFDRRGRMPGKRETTVVESIAAQMASVLERVVLLRESAVQHRMQRDLQSASANQVGGSSRQHIRHSKLDIAAVCTSRYELGGDLCELIRIDEQQTVIAVGDAAGDSVPAAMVMSVVRGSLRTLANEPLVADTAAVMQRINHMLHQVTPAHQFMSLLYGIFDTSDNSFVYTNAGHPMPVLLHQGQSSLLNSHGLLLGINSDTTYDHSIIKLEPNDWLVMFSDGVSEARNGQRQMFGAAGIVEVLNHAAADSAKQLLHTIWSRLDAHTDDANSADDRTLLVIRVR